MIISLRQEGLSHRKIPSPGGLSQRSVMPVLDCQRTCEMPQPWTPSLPTRPRNSENTLPDFERVAKMEASGLTVKDAWRDYARSNAAAYSYAYFSTLYRVWLDDPKKSGTTNGLNVDVVENDDVASRLFCR